MCGVSHTQAKNQLYQNLGRNGFRMRLRVVPDHRTVETAHTAPVPQCMQKCGQKCGQNRHVSTLPERVHN